MSDYYSLMGIPKTATEDEIKKAYRDLAKKYHPDKNPDDKTAESKFKEIKEAYETLIDDEKRQLYDTYGTTDTSKIRHSSKSPFGDGSSDIFETLFKSGFADLFGMNRRTKNIFKQDIKQNITLNINDVFCGTKRKINYNAVKACPSCFTKRKSSLCSDCNGSGTVQKLMGFIVQNSPCNTCRGSGFTVPVSCNDCSNAGFFQHTTSAEVVIPSGVTAGSIMTISGKGSQGFNGTGDLLIQISVADNQNFSLHGADVYYTLSLDVLDLVLGSKKELKLPDNRNISFDIPPGTQISDLVRIKGEGITTHDGRITGDLYLKMNPFVPKLNQEKVQIIKKELNATKQD